MKINEVEQQVGITKKNIRFYEEEGLISPKRNHDNGYRDYNEDDVETLFRIKLFRKLGLPLEEIRAMQVGNATVADCMKRHKITIEREKENLAQAEAICNQLTDREYTLGTLDAKELLQNMEQLEAGGTAFRNKQQYDVRISYVAPVVITVVLILFMVLIMGIMYFSVISDPEDAPPAALIAIFFMIPVLIMIGAVLALRQRIFEIRKGEMEDARKY